MKLIADQMKLIADDKEFRRIMDRAAICSMEYMRAYALAGLQRPDEEILQAMAFEAAQEIRIPDKWIHRLFTVARREYRAIPRLCDLQAAYKNFIRDEIDDEEKKTKMREKLTAQAPSDDDDDEEAMREFYLFLDKHGVKLNSNARKKYLSDK